MRLTISSTEAVPFSGARQLVALSEIADLLPRPARLHLRPVTHVLPDVPVSLSDSQPPGDQLRFYSRERVARGWRFVGSVLAEALGPVQLDVHGGLSRADVEFVDALRAGGLDLTVTVVGAVPTLVEDDTEDAVFVRHARHLERGEVDEAAVGAEIDRLLACADSWAALALARLLEDRGPVTDPRVATSVALSYGLQGCNDDAERLFGVWESAGGLEAARARYSLAMLYARHHDAERRSAGRAAAYLQSAYELLRELPATPAVRYERVFNRNGYALLLFRAGRLADAAELLEHGIVDLRGSDWGGALHHTALLNNLGRVYAAMGQSDRAEVALSEAVGLDPLFAEYRQDLASFLVDQHRYSDALVELDRAHELDPAVAEIVELHAFACLNVGRADQAAIGYERAWRMGAAGAGLSLLRTLSDLGSYERAAAIAPDVVASLTSQDERAEAELIALEARSMRDSDVDLVAELTALAAKYPSSELVKENAELVGAGS